MSQAPMNGGQGLDVPVSVADVSEHVGEVLEAAERAAAASVEQARAEGERRVGAARQRAQELVDERSAQIRTISGDLLQQVADVEERLTKLDGALAKAMEDLRVELERLPAPPSDDLDENDDAEPEPDMKQAALAR